MSALRLVRYDDAVSFLAEAGDYLAAREAEHNLLLGICGRLRANPHIYGTDPYFAAAFDGEAVAGVAIRTPPFNLILSEQDDLRAIDAFVADAVDAFEALPGVLGPKEAARRFADLWCRRTGVDAAITREDRAFRCARVVPPAGVPGAMRRADATERDLLVSWMIAFVAEALPEGSPQPPERAVSDYLSRTPPDGAYVWVDGDPVSFAACGSPTPNGVRVGPVYTPPELRGRGYASALVASMTRLQLESGRTFCFLFTDLSNPTSNRIYQRIGYEPVADVDEYHFSGG